jgi:dephospho-CoA kinase
MLWYNLAMKVIGLAGPHAGGKDALAEYLEKIYNFYHVSLGDISREEAMKKYGSIERPILYKTANEIRHNEGAGALGHRAIKRYESVKEQYPAGLIVSGFRTIAEAKAIKDAGGIIIYVDAPESLRYERLVTRARAEEGTLSYEEFKKREDAENGGVDPEFSIIAVKNVADHVMENNGSFEDFIKLVTKTLEL